MLRTRRSAIVLCVAFVLCVALVPAPFLSAAAVLVPLWPVFGFVPQMSLVCSEDEPTQQSTLFLSLLAPRPPPA